MSTPRKTADEFFDNSIERAKTEPFLISEFDDEHYSVFNELTNGEYIVTVDNELLTVIDCTCPHRMLRLININNSGIPCKHMVAVGDYLNYEY